jgi:hypothetical protein
MTCASVSSAFIGRERIHQPRCEVQRRRRRRHRAGLGGEHRLVIVRVPRVGRPLARDIGRQRHAADALEQELDRLGALEGQQQAAVLPSLRSDGGNALAERHHLAFAQSLGVAYEGTPGPGTFALVQRRPDAGVAPVALELRRDDAGIVENEQVPAPQQARQVGYPPIGKPASIDAKQAGAVARRRRP